MTVMSRLGNGRMRLVGVSVAVAAVVVGLAGCSSSPTAASGTTTTPPTTTKAGASHRATRSVTGQITAENGQTWTVANKAGKQFTVNITANTHFGTKKQPATEQQFTVGSQVRVTGTVKGTTVDATTIAVPPQPGVATTTPSPTPTS